MFIFYFLILFLQHKCSILRFVLFFGHFLFAISIRSPLGVTNLVHSMSFFYIVSHVVCSSSLYTHVYMFDSVFATNIYIYIYNIHVLRCLLAAAAAAAAAVAAAVLMLLHVPA